MKVSDYILKFFEDIGVEYIFVVTGAAIAEMIDSFSRNNRVKYICMVHEQAGSFAGETLTKTSDIIGVNYVTSGPGGINLITGIANCWYDSIPNIFITGQINSNFLKGDRPLRQIGFQENDIVSMVKPITKYAYLITEVKEVKFVLQKALYEATHGRPGPVLIDIPMNIQKQEIEVDSLVEFSPPIVHNNISLINDIENIITKLLSSERPVLVAGGGVRLSGAIEEIRELGHLLKIPCYPTWNALDIFDSEYEYYGGRIGTYGGPGRNFGVQNCDFLLSIGCRFSGRVTGGMIGSFAREAYKVIVDIDAANTTSILQQVKGNINICCDAKFFLTSLIEKVKKTKIKSFQPWLKQTRHWLTKYDPVLSEYYADNTKINPYVFIAELSKQVDRNAVIVADCGGNVVVTNQAFKTKKGQRLCSSNGNSPMGFSMAGAIGAYYANPDKQIVCIIGDGGFTMNIQELQTIKNYKIPIKVFILNNRVYGIIKAFQDTNLKSKYLASGPDGYSPPNFNEICEAYGVNAITINLVTEIQEKIAFTLNFSDPIICNVNMADQFSYEPRIFGWNTPIEDMYPYLSRNEFISNMIIRPIDGWQNPIMPQKIDKAIE